MELHPNPTTNKLSNIYKNKNYEKYIEYCFKKIKNG